MIDNLIIFGFGIVIFCVIVIIGEYLWGDKNE